MGHPKKYETFLYRVYKKVKPTSTGCFEFYGHLNEHGYGRVRKDSKLVYIHREIYKEFFGSFDEKLSVCHKCDNPCCINHNHLFLGTHKQNMEDKARKGRVPDMRGDKSNVAKLSSKDIPLIRKRIKDGETCYSIAREYGVTGEAILAIKHNRTWQSVA
ncbi:MAG: HNH endonuclease [Patescibacteria group bacterium]|nr:HNH endonuclease [Patescibacteria group bacterium]